jgi:hypothetical protein
MTAPSTAPWCRISNGAPASWGRPINTAPALVEPIKTSTHTAIFGGATAGPVIAKVKGAEPAATLVVQARNFCTQLNRSRSAMGKPLSIDIPGLPIATIGLRAELAKKQLKTLLSFDQGGLSIDVAQGRDSLWLLVRRQGKGGIALRAAYCAGAFEATIETPAHGEQCRLTLAGPLGRHEIRVTTPHDSAEGLRMTANLTPSEDVLLPFLPRDLYPLGRDDDPATAVGRVEAAQRGVNAGLVYLCLSEPAFGSVFYFQNLTALNNFFEQTGTKPDGVVGGQWPELGYLPPASPEGNSPPTKPMAKGRTLTLSDVILRVEPACDNDERDSALRFLKLLGSVYAELEAPPPIFRDWVWRSKRTLRDLQKSEKATIRHYGATYIHPYTDAEYPDSMVQMSVLTGLDGYLRWAGETSSFTDDLHRGLGKFFDPKLGVVRRYLPNVGNDKNADAVDSWYLYHPLTNLARLAKDGDAEALKLFLGSLDYAIRAAHHFKYKWPIQYDVRDFKVLVEARNDQGLGQTDVGGIYAYVMLQAYELTKKRRFLGEATKAIRASAEMRFELAYQTNLTAWGAVAALKLWKITGDDWFRRQSYVFVAGLFHNCEIWESQVEHARHYRNFLGLTCLHDAPYMALYECFETFAAFDEYAEVGGEDIDHAARLLISEYRRYTLDRAWFYYPDALPKEILAKEVRNGHIDRKLSFPLEDLYGDGQPPGQVGQEIYGCGAAFMFASRAFHRLKGVPFVVFADRRVTAFEQIDKRTLRLRADTPAGLALRLSIAKGRQPLPKVQVETEQGLREASQTEPDHIDFELPAGEDVLIHWGPNT